MKKSLIVYGLILVIAVVVGGSFVNSGLELPPYILDNATDTVYINDSRAYISASPITREGNGKVDFELLSKTYTGDMNIALLFNSSNVKPTALYSSVPRVVTVQHNFTCESDEFGYDLDDNTWWCQVYIEDFDNFTVNGSFEGGNLASRTVWWTTTETIPYTKINTDFSTHSIDFDGKDTLYAVTNVGFVAGVPKKYAIDFEMPSLSFSESQWWDSKYGVAVWPSSYGSRVRDAYDDGNLYYLDPWTGGTTDLESCYDFDTDALDSYSDNNFTVTSATLTTGDGGIIDEAYDYDGNNDKLTQQRNFNPGTGDFTVSFWLESDDLTNEKYVLNMGYNDANGLIFFTQSNDLRIVVGESGTWEYLTQTITITSGWNHILATREGEDINVWLNNISVLDSTNSKNNFPFDGTIEIGFSAARNKAGTWLNGRVDQLVIFKRVATDSEIDELYNDGSGLSCSDITSASSDSCTAPSVDTDWNIVDDCNITLESINLGTGDLIINSTIVKFNASNITYADLFVLSGKSVRFLEGSNAK